LEARHTTANKIKAFISRITGHVDVMREAGRGYQSFNDESDKNATMTMNDSKIEESYVMNQDEIFELKIDIQPFAHPNDINWRNITMERKFIGLKRIGLFIVSILILIFATTPTSLVELLSGNTINFRNASYMVWVENSPSYIKVVFKAVFPALVVIWVNQILLYIIYVLVNFESHHRYSTYQISTLTKTFWYFLMNMIIMPGFAVVAFSNIYEVLSKGLTSEKSIFAQLFMFDVGDLFVNVVIQNASATVLWRWSSLSDLFWSYMSPTLMIKFRDLTTNKPNWMKFDYDIYTYGNNYAQHTVIMGIAIVFQ